MKKTLLVLGIVALILSYCSCCLAETFIVSTPELFQKALDSADHNGQDDTITLNEGIYVASPDTFSFSSSQSDRGHSLTIIGSGDVILDGDESRKILDINCNYMTDITLQNLTIKDGYATNSGAGTCIWLEAGNVEIIECSFNNNIAEDDGGALSAWIEDSGNINVTSCNFTENSTTAVNGNDGGAIYAYISGTGDMALQGNTFTENTANLNGGAAYLYSEVGDLNVIGNTCTSNDAGSDGGALYLDQDYAGTNTVKDNIFRTNTADDGGAVYFYLYQANIFNCVNNIFEDNEAVSDGGALYQDGDYNTVTYLFDNYFNGNNSDSEGGGALIQLEYGGQLTMVSNDFYQNVAGYSGGGAYLVGYEDGCSFYVDSSSFSENRSSITGDDDDEKGGGGLYFNSDGYDATIISVTNSTFTNNTSAYGAGGGAFLYQDYNNCIVSGNNFSNNAASKAGGGLYGYAGSANLFCSDNVFASNVVSSDFDGGGAYLDCGEGDLTVENSSFINNVGGNKGGALYVEQTYGDFLFRNNLIAGNTSPYEGGGVYIYPNRVRYADLINNTITGNIVSEDGHSGGGISIECRNENTVFSIYNNIVWGNTASDGNDILLKDGNGENSFINYFSVCNNNFSVLSHDFTASSDLYETANVNEDPMFVSSTDFHLQAGSPLIDLGDAFAPSLPEIDLDDNDRVTGDNVDMGAYEYGSGTNDIDTSTTTTTSGSGGCNTGAFVPSLLLLLAPLFFLAKKR